MNPDHYSRQSFLGAGSQSAIARTVVGVVGLGGGGSQIIDQLAHVGFKDYVLADPDIVECHNLNRLVGATVRDAEGRCPKIDVARRAILALQPDARIDAVQKKWQDDPLRLRRCDLLFGAVDGFDQRRQLETLARNFLIPYIDIGMDVLIVEPEPPRVAGQVILSMPGRACMHCLGFLSPESLAKEAGRYGDAGPRPQVIWSNGGLASSAVGIAVDLITDWTKKLRRSVYLLYDGNTGLISTHPRVPYFNRDVCPHFPLERLGTPRIQSL